MKLKVIEKEYQLTLRSQWQNKNDYRRHIILNNTEYYP